MPYIRHVLLTYSSRVRNRGADVIGRYDVLYNRGADVIGWYDVLYNRGSDVIGRCDIFVQQGGRCYRAECYFLVKTVLLFLVEDFTSILLFVGFFPSRIVTVSL